MNYECICKYLDLYLNMKSMKLLPSFSFDIILGVVDAATATSGFLSFTTLLLALSSEAEEVLLLLLLLGNGQDIENM